MLKFVYDIESLMDVIIDTVTVHLPRSLYLKEYIKTKSKYNSEGLTTYSSIAGTKIDVFLQLD